jgi:hypothetical protein
MTEEDIIRIIDARLAHHIKQSKYVFDRPIQVLDGNDVVLSSEHGTRFGTDSTQKIAFLGATPIPRYGPLTYPSGGTVIDAEARSAASDALYVLSQFGLLDVS